MPYTNDDAGDFEKLQRAFVEIASKFGSFDDVLAAFGLQDMPPAQRYGILFGVVVFCCTVAAVLMLLAFGGSFRRMKEQAETGQATILSPAEARQQRSLLLERLLDGRERMMQRYEQPALTDQPTKLTKMLLNEAPASSDDGDPDLVDDENKDTTNKGKGTSGEKKEVERYIPPYYEENYIKAYRKCQDRPGGPVLSGRPEARFEAYARGFAGCGSYTDPAYRRSYGRMYEAICCVNHKQDDKFAQLFKTRPHDVVGKYVRLEALEADRHVNDLFQITCGDTVGDHKAYDPNEVWGFLPDGPFESPTEMRQSFVFQRKPNEASFAIVNNVTDRVVGAILLTSDDPANLSIQIEPPIMPPKGDGTKEQMEACFLLIDRLFAFGYRRIQIATDSQDALQRKLATRLGFTLEGVLYKHQIIKEASRDSAVAGLLNSDWSRGARTALFSKLYGNAAARADRANEKKEEEYDEQQRVLEKQKQEEAAAAAAKDKKV